MSDLRYIIEQWKGVSIGIIGDAITDHYLFGTSTRLAPEGPVPVFVPKTQEWRPGGALNVQAQLNALGAHASVHQPPECSTKVRAYIGAHMLWRCDLDEFADPLWTTEQEVRDFARDKDVLVLSDYNKGALTEQVSRWAISTGVPTIVDPKSDSWKKYRGAATICPNSKELAAWKATNETITSLIVEKCGPDGIRVHGDGPVLHDPARTQSVYDVTGAGDAVVAVIALCHGKVPIDQAIRLANIVAGYCVGQVGTTVCPLEKLLAG